MKTNKKTKTKKKRNKKSLPCSWWRVVKRYWCWGQQQQSFFSLESSPTIVFVSFWMFVCDLISKKNSLQFQKKSFLFWISILFSLNLILIDIQFFELEFISYFEIDGDGVCCFWWTSNVEEVSLLSSLIVIVEEGGGFVLIHWRVTWMDDDNEFLCEDVEFSLPPSKQQFFSSSSSSSTINSHR